MFIFTFKHDIALKFRIILLFTAELFRVVYYFLLWICLCLLWLNLHTSTHNDKSEHHWDHNDKHECMFVTQPFLYVCYACAKSYGLLSSISVLLRPVSQNPNKTHFLLYCFPRKDPINIQTIFIPFLLLCNIVLCRNYFYSLL